MRGLQAWGLRALPTLAKMLGLADARELATQQARVAWEATRVPQGTQTRVARTLAAGLRIQIASVAVREVTRNLWEPYAARSYCSISFLKATTTCSLTARA